MSVFTAGVYRLNILKKLKKELFYAGLSREAYHKVSDAVWDSNRTAIIVWSLFAALFWIMSLDMSLNAEAFKACRTVYIIALIICAVTMVVALFLARRISWILFPITALFVLSLHGAGIGIAICQPDVRTVTLIVFSAITPISTIKRTSISIESSPNQWRRRSFFAFGAPSNKGAPGRVQNWPFRVHHVIVLKSLSMGIRFCKFYPLRYRTSGKHQEAQC